VQPIEQIAQITSSRGVPLHVDAVQAAGAIRIDLASVPVDLLTVSAHKFYGPKGVGALVVRGGTPWWPLLAGGGQERNRRAGTENVAGIAGMATALRLAVEERVELHERLRSLRDSLLGGILERIDGVRVNGALTSRLPGNLNLSFDRVHGESLLVALDLAGIYASSGSACTSGSTEPSHVLLALGIDQKAAQGSLRLTVGRENTAEEIRRTVDVLDRVVRRVRSVAPMGAA
jgi:cysteine desulfurase